MQGQEAVSREAVLKRRLWTGGQSSHCSSALHQAAASILLPAAKEMPVQRPPTWTTSHQILA